MKIVKKLFKQNNIFYLIALLLFFSAIEYKFNLLNVNQEKKSVKYVIFECIDDHGWLCGGWVCCNKNEVWFHHSFGLTISEFIGRQTERNHVRLRLVTHIRPSARIGHIQAVSFDKLSFAKQNPMEQRHWWNISRKKH